ncbi:hypothetical protein [Glaciecola sp. SC05]|uniref:DUF6988 family protein n=1 Tax=Glaciecola sp. SC05 TaxID=1987355 RepID=UPI0035283892
MDDLLEKSEGLNSEFSRIFEYGIADNSKRLSASWIMCLVALEHANSLRQLAMCGNYTSAICIIRSQFEALTRATWLFYAASDTKVDNTFSTLSELSQSADQKPNNAEMIKALEGKAPAQAAAMFSEFRDVQWKGLNSYVHGTLNSLNESFFSAFTPHKERMVARLIQRKARNILIRKSPDWRQIMSGNAEVTFNTDDLFEKETINIDRLLKEKDILKIISRYPIRETPALESISRLLGFQSKEKYEQATRKMLIDDDVAKNQILNILEPVVQHLEYLNSSLG